MNLLKFSIGLTLFTSTFFAACKKDDDDDGEPSENACKVTSAQYSLGQSTINATYTYNGNQVTKVQFPTFNYTFDYTGNNISKRNYFLSAGANPEIYDQISYNTDGTISRIESYAQDTSGTSYLPAQRIDFSYSGGKLSKTSFYELDGAISDLYLENTYTYTGNNISSLSMKEITDTGDITGTVNYTYDTNPNYFKKQNSQAYMIDILFNPILLDDGSFLPMVFSENNVTKISTSDITYESDTRQNVTNVKVGANSLARYTYQCP
jgi:hypothetical protein